MLSSCVCVCVCVWCVGSDGWGVCPLSPGFTMLLSPSGRPSSSTSTDTTISRSGDSSSTQLILYSASNANRHTLKIPTCPVCAEPLNCSGGVSAGYVKLAPSVEEADMLFAALSKSREAAQSGVRLLGTDQKLALEHTSALKTKSPVKKRKHDTVAAQKQKLEVQPMVPKPHKPAFQSLEVTLQNQALAKQVVSLKNKPKKKKRKTSSKGGTGKLGKDTAALALQARLRQGGSLFGDSCEQSEGKTVTSVQPKLRHGAQETQRKWWAM